MLNALLDEVTARYRVDPDRVYVTGLSMGGRGTWDVAIEYPDRFAALAPICGSIPAVEDASRIRHVTVWAFLGAQDGDQSIRQMVEALQATGANATLTVYPDTGHDAWTPTYANPAFFEWLLGQRRMPRLTNPVMFTPPPREELGVPQPISVRDAEETDLPALIAIKGEGSEAVHRDRLRDAPGGDFRYLVLLRGREAIGFALLVFRRPASWSDANDTQNLPQMVDLRVAESLRGQGYGSAFVRAIEREAAQARYHQLYLSVQPANNPRAHAFYRRLGYQQIQPEPYLKIWEFIDSAGERHHGEDWVVDMVKPLPN